MCDTIERIYCGLPAKLKEYVFWVERERRTNELSHKEGGEDVIVVYKSGKVLGYDWIKDVYAYVRSIETFKECWILDPESGFIGYTFDLEKFKSKVKSIYFRKYKVSEYKSVPFEFVWDSETSEVEPLVAIKKYLDGV